jgi:endonuclease YncB( thermonuclease family)
MLMIEGTYQVIGARPDGDSVRFYANQRDHWDRVEGPYRVRLNASGGAQLRLDGIDSLETHYSTEDGETHQPLEQGHAAAQELLTWLGFTSISRDPHETVTNAAPAKVPGYILTRGADLHGRCVAIAGRGPAPGESGRSIDVDVDLLRTTANHHLLLHGTAYPTFYRKLYVDLRDELTAVTAQARSRGAGLWPQDVTTTGAKVQGLDSLADDLTIMPKLFRRLADFLTLGDGTLPRRVQGLPGRPRRPSLCPVQGPVDRVRHPGGRHRRDRTPDQAT